MYYSRPVEELFVIKLNNIMARKVITVTHPDGTKKVIVGKQSNEVPVKTREPEKDRRAKSIVTKAGLTKERTPYSHGGQFKLKSKNK